MILKQLSLIFVERAIDFQYLLSLFDCMFILQPIYLKGEKYLLKGLINVDSSLLQLPEDITVDVISGESNAFEVTRGSLISDGDEQTKTAAYQYSVWGNIGDKLTFIPRDSRYICLMAFVLFAPLSLFLFV